MYVVLHRSVFGRYLFAVGKNEEAARYAGVPTGKVIVAAYVICAVLTAIAAIFFAMYTKSISPSSHGNFYELYAIAAAVLGGFSLRGGEGSIVGVVLGAVLLQVLQNLVNLLGIPSSLNFAVMGVGDPRRGDRRHAVRRLPPAPGAPRPGGGAGDRRGDRPGVTTREAPRRPGVGLRLALPEAPVLDRKAQIARISIFSRTFTTCARSEPRFRMRPSMAMTAYCPCRPASFGRFSIR